jgi:hypothetical protein
VSNNPKGTLVGHARVGMLDAQVGYTPTSTPRNGAVPVLIPYFGPDRPGVSEGELEYGRTGVTGYPSARTHTGAHHATPVTPAVSLAGVTTTRGVPHPCCRTGSHAPPPPSR